MGRSVSEKNTLPVRFRGVHLLAVAAILLAAAALRATEVYATRYQSLPVSDWLESRPPLLESASDPAADDLARGLARTMPLLVIADDARPWLPIFGPPGVIQRTIGGVRDASRIVLASPGSFGPNQPPVQIRLYTAVFNRTLRAVAWTELMAREMDARDPESGLNQERVAGPDDPDVVWIVSPHQTGGIATVVGHRGAVAFELQVTLGPTPSVYAADSTIARPEVIDLDARAEALARQAAADWTNWLSTVSHS